MACIKSSQSAVNSPVDVPLLPSSRPRRLVAVSHQLQYQDSPLMAAGPRYMASAQTTQRTQPQQLFHCCMRVSCGHYLAMVVVYRDITYQWLLYGCLFCGRCLAMGLHATLLPP
jgi:hypothetical protein